MSEIKKAMFFRHCLLKQNSSKSFDKLSINKYKMLQKKYNSYLLILLSVLSILCFSCQTGSKKCKTDTNKDDSNSFQKTDVWKPDETNVEGYRIPGIVVTNEGTVLAFAEERPIFGDEEPKSIVLKRSIDGAQTWSNNIYIEKCNGEYWLNHINEIGPRDNKDKKEVWTNTAPIVDTTTGRILFFYSLSEGAVSGQNLQRYTKVFYKYSDDDGLTWSDRNEVTDVINAKENGMPNKDENGNWVADANGFPCDYLGRAFHMPGPGHGIQLSNGRLLLQVWNRTALESLDNGVIPVSERKYGICTIYSDDHGSTWKYGSAFGHNGLTMNESRMAELENGDVYMNARYVIRNSGEKNNYRIKAISHDKGITWSDVKIDKNFPLSNPCDAGLVAIRDKKTNKNLLLYSKNESSEGRENLVVRLSYDEGKTWPIVKVVDKGPAWYSDLAVLPDNSILLIYEIGKNSPVYCVKFNLEWITNSN